VFLYVYVAFNSIFSRPNIDNAYSTTLRPGDEFIVLGCDGIWDCLSNEECVKYVRDRIDTKSPVEIGTEMLDDIVSEDPRASQGIGGDNMTVMIIDLLPESRQYSHQ
jgi:serine/threonine protein phosphatase PrpC